VWRPVAGVRSFFENPASRKLTIQRAQTLLRSQARKFLGLTPVDLERLPEAAEVRKYQKPSMRQITPQQASLFFIGHATIGDRGAKEFMEVVLLARSAPRRRNAPREAAAFNPSRMSDHSPAPDCP
jgi:hypothetical protein